MVVRDSAPPAPWSDTLAQPKIDETAYVHSFSNIIGDVQIDANVLVAPGTSIRADEGSPFHVGEGSNVQDGAVIHGLEQAHIVGDDQKQYSVWIGKNTSITHMALVHGPAYVGDDCFIGFRSTVFNARIGNGCIVMMHVLIQDVEIPPGKYVPSGSIITTQQQADRLPDVQSVDIQFATHVVGINDALRSGYQRAENVASVTPIGNQLDNSQHNHQSENSSDRIDKHSSHRYSQAEGTHMNHEVVEHVRHLLAQGYRIGIEHADARRFQTSSWKSCPSSHSNRESDVFADLEACLADHAGEYVRVYGIDTKSKSRVAEKIVQRPGDSPTAMPKSASSKTAQSYSSSPRPQSGSNGNSLAYSGRGSLSTETVETVRNLLSQGYLIGTEHADARRFQTSSWKTCTPIGAGREPQVLQALEGCLAEHSGEYVRLFGIDSKSKSRVGELIVQRPGDRKNGGAASGGAASSQSQPFYRDYSSDRPPARESSNKPSGGTQRGRLSPDVVQQVRQLLAQGHRISAEHADARRFQTSSWKSCGTIQSTRESDVFAALEDCMSANPGEYVRLLGVDTKSKRRVAETIIQRP